MSWREIALGDEIEIKHGFAFKSQFYADSGQYILLTPGNCLERGGLKLKGDKEKYYIGEIPDEFVLSKGDMIVVMTDLVSTAPILGGAFVIPENDKFLHNQRLGLVRLKSDNLDNRFLYYLFNTHSYRAQVRGSATGATVRHTAPKRIYRCKVRIPSKETQTHIADILSAYDDLIENNRRRIALLEQSARELYREWFVRLRFPGHERKKIDDGLPEGWATSALEEIAKITMGQSPKSMYYNEEGDGLPFHQGVTDFGNRFPSHEVYCTVENRIADPGDLLFSVRAPVGRINITLDKVVIGRGIAAIRSIRNQQSLLFYALKSHFFREDMLGAGAIFAAIKKQDLYGVRLTQANDEVAHRFMDLIEPIDSEIEKLHLMIGSLAQARDLLLPRLMSGKLNVRQLQ